MKKSTILVFVMLLTAFTQAQNYQLSFTGSGDANTVKNVVVENLTQVTSLTINGSDILHLVGTVGIDSKDVENNSISVFPNPMNEKANIEFFSKSNTNADVQIFDISGKLILKSNQAIHQGKNSFELSGLSAGFYTINIITLDEQFSKKIISKGGKGLNPVFRDFTPSDYIRNTLNTNKSAVQMQYNEGDLLMLRGLTVNYSTVLTLIPSSNMEINFEFSACIDGDGNNYPIVKIGNQTWMAENLKTTRFSDSTEIPSVNSNNWIYLTTPGFCWFNNDEMEYKNEYGALYNWYAVSMANNGNKNICPEGWHVPSDAEWTELSTILGANSASKLRESGNAHWSYSGISGTNETGFSALPAGYRGSIGSFLDMEYIGSWWSNSASYAEKAWRRAISYDENVIQKDDVDKINGLSVRCIKD